MTKRLQFTLTMYKVLCSKKYYINCFQPVTNVSKLFEIYFYISWSFFAVDFNQMKCGNAFLLSLFLLTDPILLPVC